MDYNWVESNRYWIGVITNRLGIRKFSIMNIYINMY